MPCSPLCETIRMISNAGHLLAGVWLNALRLMMNEVEDMRGRRGISVASALQKRSRMKAASFHEN